VPGIELPKFWLAQGPHSPFNAGFIRSQSGTKLRLASVQPRVVEVTRRVPHPMYKRIVTKKKKFYAHDEEQTAKVGDVVRILEHRPLSKLKRWKLGDIIRRAVQVGVEPSILADPNLQLATAGHKSIKK